MATEAIRLYVELEVLYPVLPFSAPCVKFVEGLRFVVPRANDEAPVGPSLHDFGLVDDPALLLPACRLVGILAEEPGFPRRPLMLLAGFFEQPLGDLFESGVRDEGDDVGDALPLAVVIEGGNGEA